MNCQFRPQKSKWCKSGVNRRMQNRKVVAALRESDLCFNTAVADEHYFDHRSNLTFFENMIPRPSLFGKRFLLPAVNEAFSVETAQSLPLLCLCGRILGFGQMHIEKLNGIILTNIMGVYVWQNESILLETACSQVQSC